MPFDPTYTPALMNERGRERLPGLVGMAIDEISPGLVRAHLDIRTEHLAPNGYLHAATVIALADTACGYGALANRAEGATGFTTIELKTNFLGTARDGAISCLARMVHGGRMTQVWDAEVSADGSRPIAVFRCTQMMLHPR